MLIVGGPGPGKSSIATRLVELAARGEGGLRSGSPSAAHFCRALVDQTLDPRRVFEALALQLAERYPVFADALVSAPEAGVTVSLVGTANAGTAARRPR